MKKYKKAYLEITNICNKSCSFCHGTKREKAVMDEKHFIEALEKLEGSCEYLYFHLLGEPLCHPEVIRYIREATKRHFKVSITTNGTLLPLCSDALVKSGVVKVSVSLHSLEGGDVEEYLKGVIDFAKKASAEGILVSLRLWNKGCDNRTTEEMLKSAFPKWDECRNDSFRLIERVYLEYAPRFDWPDIERKAGEEKRFCYGLRDQFGILVDGSVVPCCLDAEGDITLGNIFEDTLENILTSKRAREIKDGFDRRIAVEELCKRCPYSERF